MVPAEQALRVAGGGHRVVRRREDGEELVTAGVDLVARGARDRLAQQLPDVGEDGLPLGAEVVGEARRALDVGEEEGDCSGRERAHAVSLGGWSGGKREEAFEADGACGVAGAV